MGQKYPLGSVWGINPMMFSSIDSCNNNYTYNKIQPLDSTYITYYCFKIYLTIYCL